MGGLSIDRWKMDITEKEEGDKTFSDNNIKKINETPAFFKNKENFSTLTNENNENNIIFYIKRQTNGKGNRRY